MIQIVALHHISLPDGGTATPGEMIHSAFSPDQLSRLLRLNAIRVEGMDEEANLPADSGEASTEGGQNDGLPPRTHIPSGFGHHRGQAPALTTLDDCEQSPSLAGLWPASGTGETPPETPQDAPESSRNDADEDDVDEDGEGDTDGAEAIMIDAADSVIETPQTPKQPTAPKRASVKKAAKKGGTGK